MKCKRLFGSFFLLLVPLILGAQPPAAKKILENSGHRLVLHFTSREADVRAQLSAAVTLAKASGAGVQAPALFAASELLLLPPEGDYSLDIRADNRRHLSVPALPPAAGIPTMYARITGEAWWRGFRIARLQVSPAIQAGSGTVELAEDLTVSVQFPRPSGSLPATSLLPEERHVLKPFLNRQRAPGWRRRRAAGWPALAPLAAKDSVFFRIRLQDPGFYRVTYEDLAGAGGQPASLNPQNLHLYNRGQAQPLYFHGDTDAIFEPGEEIWFYGDRLHGRDGEWLNDETGVNVYLLVPESTPGMRFRERRLPDASGALAAQRFWQSIHFETDVRYYHGDDDADIFTTARIPGEGWVWTTLLGTQSFGASLVLPNVLREAPVCSLRARVRGITKDPARPNHHVQLSLNEAVVADQLFSNNEEVLLQAAFPSNLIQNGANSLRVFSVGDTRAAIDQFYFDWVEIGYWRTYVAADNRLEFAPQRDFAGAMQQFQISNLHEPEIFLFERTAGERLTGFSQTEINPAQFFIAFSDSVNPSQRFVAFTPAALKTPLAIETARPHPWGAATNQADMLILSHGRFIEQAERLAAHRRRQNGFAVAVVDVQDIYDLFNSGLPSWRAIRAFLAHAAANWQPPAPRYVLLFGDGSWDPRKNAPGSHKESFIPTIGNPVSDNRYVCLDGPDDFIPDLFIGRLAVETSEQAAAVVDKILSYESRSVGVQDWAKDFVFLNGGIDAFEQNLFRTQSERLIRRYVEPGPVGGKAIRLYKRTQGRFAGELLPEIVTTIDSGTVMLAFSGHAGSQTWELMMVNDDIARLQNEGRLPFIASMTCHTARFAEPAQNSFGEDFLRLPERGAVAFWGTSGWGFAFQDGVLLDGLFAAIAGDSVRAAGVGVVRAKLHLWREYGSYSTNINIIDQYTLLGDPALTLALPTAPDLALSATGISTLPANPSESDSLVDLQVVIRNRGLSTVDSTDLVVRARKAEAQADAFRAVLPVGPVDYADTVRVRWPGGPRKGEYTASAQVDAGGRIPEISENNNSAAVPVYFYTSSLSLAAPRDMQIVPDSRPELSIYNPDIGTGARQYVFELDTLPSFDSPFRISSGPIDEQPVRTAWQVPVALAPGKYHWRSRTVTEGAFGVWQRGFFFVDTTTAGSGFWQRGAAWAFASGSFQQRNGEALLPPDSLRLRHLQVESGGFFDLSRCYLIIDGITVNRSGRGHNLVALDPVTGRMLFEPRFFDTSGSPTAADSLAALLEGLPPRTLLLIGIRDDGSVQMTERAHRALELFGSALTRQVGFRDSWAMVGAKGMPRGAAAEQHKVSRAGQAVATRVLLPFRKTGRIVSPPIGPASSWAHLETTTRPPLPLFAATDKPGAALDVSVEGRRRATDAWQTVRRNLPAMAALGNIDAMAFPFLRLKAGLRDDDGLDSPRLAGWRVSFSPRGDLVMAPAAVTLQADSLLPGELFNLRVRAYFFGSNPPDSVTLALMDAGGGAEQAGRSTQKVPLAAGVARADFSWSSLTPGKASLHFAVDPEDEVPEPFEFNNLATRDVFVRPDTTAPEIAITFDGNAVIEGALVAARPEIVCAIFDENRAAIRDTAQVDVFIDGARISYADPEAAPRLALFTGGRKIAELALAPALTPGEHTLSVLVRDLFGNRAAKSILVKVSDTFELQEVMNYPNPFAGQTAFTFILTQPADEIRIKIYTVAGRLIQTLDFLNPAVGFNSFRWDGRDADADALANGVYLYKIIARQGENQIERIEKLAIAR